VISRVKSLAAFQIEPNAAEEVRQILDSVTTSFKDFDLVIQAFDPTARKARDEVIGDFLHPSLQRREEFVEATRSSEDPSPKGHSTTATPSSDAM
jgi:hypothetical protein